MNRVIVCIFFAFFCIDAGALTLVEDGKSGSVIVTAASPAPCVKVAAKELSSHLEKMSGAKIPIVKAAGSSMADIERAIGGKNAILLGNGFWLKEKGVDINFLPSEGFMIKADGRYLIIAGKDGSSYGDNYRVFTESAGTLYGVYRFLEEMGVRWFYPLELGTVIPQEKTIRISDVNITSYPANHYRHTGSNNYAWSRRISAGGDRDVWSTMHNVSIELKKYRDQHPEWFLKKDNGKLDIQADLSNPEVIDVVVKMAKARFDSNISDGAKYFLILPLDGDACIRTDSETITSSIEKVALKLKESHSAYRVVLCTYSSFRTAPERVRKLPDNMVLLIALSRERLLPPSNPDDYYKIIRDWQKFSPAAIYFCRYDGERLKMSPALIPHVIASDIKKMKELSKPDAPIDGEMNFIPITADSPYGWWEFINQYVETKMLWNPDLDVDDILDDLCEKMFGPSAKEMRKFLDVSEKAYLDPAQRDFFHPDTILRLEQLIDEAEKKSPSGVFAERIAYFSKGIEPLRALRTKLASSDMKNPALSDDALLRYYSFDNNDGNIVKDQSGVYQGEVFNAVPVDGIAGKAMSFSGEKSCLKLLPLDMKDMDYSFEAWIKPDKMEKGIQTILGSDAWQRQMLAVDYLYPTADKGVTGRGILKHRRWGAWLNIELASSLYEFKSGEWYHVVGTFSKENGMTIYINGKIAGIDLYQKLPSEFSLFFVGASGNGDTDGPELIDCFSGAIDEVKIYGRELSYPEVVQKYEQYKK